MNLNKLHLSVRKAQDVLILAGECLNKEFPASDKQITKEMLMNEALYIAQVVNDSLKATYINLMKSRNPFKQLRALNYKKFYDGATVFIMEVCSQEEITLAYQKVMELEGVKKKVVPAGNQYQD